MKEKDAKLAELGNLKFNYFHDGEFDPSENWIHDSRRERIGVDLPADSVETAGIERVQLLLESYDFPDPDLIEGYFDKERPLIGRDMLLRAKFMGFVFNFGVRIVEAVDAVKAINGKNFYCWGYSYRTLGDHFEQGQIRFEVQKALDSGEVFVEVESHSRRGEISNPFYRIGMLLFGRQLQRKFVDSTFESVRKTFAQN